MRRVQFGLLLLGLALITRTAGAQEPSKDAPPARGSWWSELFRPARKKIPPPVRAEPTLAERQRQLDRLQAALERRSDVCLKLREIAGETGDTALSREADRLEAEARRIYDVQAARLLGGIGGRSSKTPARTAGLQEEKR